MDKYYYKTEKGRFDNIICTENCHVKIGIKIGSENCSRCENFHSGSAGLNNKGWIKCNKINKMIGNKIKVKNMENNLLMM